MLIANLQSVDVVDEINPCN